MPEAMRLTLWEVTNQRPKMQAATAVHLLCTRRGQLVPRRAHAAEVDLRLDWKA